jgi:hypothetical protein
MAEAGTPDGLSRREREVIEALSRPLRERGLEARPASNQAVAGEVFLSLDAVKGHLRTIYAKLGLEELPQNAKRAELARLAAAGELDALLAERAATQPGAPAAAPRSFLRQWTPTTVLAALALALLTALALARVVPGDRAPAGGTAVGPGTAPNQIITQPRHTRPLKRGSSALLGTSETVLPVSFSTEAGGGDAPSTTTTTTGLAPRVQRKAVPVVRHVEKALPKVPATPPVTVTVPAAAPKAVNCVVRVTRVKKRVGVWRRVPRRVKVRTPHRKVRIERVVYYTRKKVVTYDKRGRRHVAWVQVRHVRIVRHPYIVWRVHWKRRMVRVRNVVTRVQLVRHRTCS